MTDIKQFYYKNNRFQQLRGFYFTAHLGSLTKAAEVMHLTQPSISLQVKALEEDLESKLFTRKGPSIQLTEEGKKLLELVKPLVEGIDSLKENFKTLIETQDSNQVSIAANQATMLYLLPKLVHAYSAAYPDMKVKIYGASSHEAVQKLRDGTVDLVVGPPNFEVPDDCAYTPLFNYDPVLITRKEHPLAFKENLSLEEIGEYHLILPPSHLRTIQGLEDLLLQHRVEPSKARLEFDGWEIVKKYVELDMAITIALSIAIEDDPVLVGTKLTNYFPRFSYGTIVKNGRILSEPAEKFLEIAKSMKQN